MLVVLVLSVLGGRAAKPAFPAVWLSALFLIPLAGYISGQQSSVTQSVTVGVQLALLCGLAPFVFKFYIENSPRFAAIVMSGFLASQTFSASVGLLQLPGNEVFGAVTIFGRSTGLAGHPNVLGIMSVFAIFVSFAAWRVLPTRFRWVPIVTVIVNGITLVSTGSLSAMLSVAVGLAAYFIGRRRVVATLVAGVLGLVAVWVFALATGLDGTAFLAPVQNRVGVVLGTSEIEGGAASLDTRLLTYDWAWRYLTIDPVAGVGLDPMNAGTYNGYTPVHNHILHAWYQGGLIFLLWMVAATIAALIMVARSIARQQNVVAAAATVAMLVFASTSAFFDQQQYWLPLLFALALIGGSSQLPKRPTDTRLPTIP